MLEGAPLRLVAQRRKRDCGVACFAMLLGITYEEATEALAQANGPLKKGLYNTSLQRGAEMLGKRLRLQRKFDADDSVGILGVENDTVAHFVVLRNGMVVDPEDQTLWNYDDYLKTNNLIPRALLVLTPATP